ncbi:hypothetical protein Q3G72_026320 [Acer saccharum]|nr:hypothetical protein Q3G72_026320 [Acer saccharum]
MAFQGIRKMPLRVFLQYEYPKPFSQKSLIFPLGPPFSFALTSNEIPPYKELGLYAISFTGMIVVEENALYVIRHRIVDLNKPMHINLNITMLNLSMQKLHCGCIMSVHTFTELDLGGLKCIECISNEESMRALKEYHHKEHILRIPETTKSLKVLSLEYIADTYFYQVLKEYHHKEHILRIPETTKSLKVLPLEYISDTYFYQVRRSLVKSREILTTSDANSKNARLVVPRKCAQDLSGKDWKLHYHFCPNKSTMYVLEGLRRYYEFHQCKPSDEVAFYRIDPEGKLVLGVKRSLATSGQKGL